MNKKNKISLKAEEKDSVKYYLVMIKALIMALLLSLILVIAYALLLSFTSLSDATMSIVTQSITIISIAFSSIYAGKKIGNKGWIYGLILGLTFIFILTPINILLGQAINIDKFFAVKTLMGSTVGLIGGIIGVNLK